MYMSGANKKSPWRLNSTESRSHTTFCKNVRGGSGGPTPCMRPLFVRPCLPPYLGDDRRGDDGGDGELCELLPESRFFASISYAFMHMFLIASNRICASSYFSWKKKSCELYLFHSSPTAEIQLFTQSVSEMVAEICSNITKFLARLQRICRDSRPLYFFAVRGQGPRLTGTYR